jgi:hypothetical protein
LFSGGNLGIPAFQQPAIDLFFSLIDFLGGYLSRPFFIIETRLVWQGAVYGLRVMPSLATSVPG